MIMDDNDGQMIFGDLGYLKLPDICLTGEENSRKNQTQETCPDRESNPGPLRDRRACNLLSAVFELYTQRAQQFSKMATGEEKAFAVFEFHSHRSIITVQRHFRTKFEKDVRVPTPFGDDKRNLKLQDPSVKV